MSQWAVAVTKPQGEADADRQLLRLGWRSYLPKHRKLLRGVRIEDTPGGLRRIRTRGRGTFVYRPLFTGYIFVEATERGWSHVLALPAIDRLVRMNAVDGPTLLDDDVVDAVREIEASGRYDEGDVAEKGIVRLPAGAKIIVPELGGLLGTLLSYPSASRARVLIYMLGGPTIANVNADTLQIAE